MIHKLARRSMTEIANTLNYLTRVKTDPRFRVPRIVEPEQLPPLTCECGDQHAGQQTVWSGVTKPIVFAYLRGTESLGSVEIRGRQMVHTLRQLGCPVAVRMQDLESLVRAKPNNTVVIALKTTLGHKSQRLLAAVARRKGNQIIADAVDGQVPTSVERQISGWLCSSLSEYTERKSRGFNVAFAVHAIDLRMVRQLSPAKRPARVVYYGKPENGAHLDKFPTIHKLKYREEDFRHPGPGIRRILTKLPQFTHHYIIRPPVDHGQHKPFTKAFVAAFMGSVVIASREDAESRILPVDYPYMSASSSAADVARTLQFAEMTYLEAPWFKALAGMAKLRKLSCPTGAGLNYVAGIQAMTNEAKASKP